jgi:hypothetical protein
MVAPDDRRLLDRIDELVNEEHRLEAEHGADHHERLQAIEVELDQCWDLLRRRRARRRAGEDPSVEQLRPAGEVEGYLQ